jgi:hypothetical protein
MASVASPPLLPARLALFSVMRPDAAVVIAQVRVPADMAEATRVASLLDVVDLVGVLVAADEAHRSPATAGTSVAGRCSSPPPVSASQP